MSILFKGLIGNTVLSDITLESFDGTVIPAVRAVLACRSTVMEKMLYGTFSEASSSVITFSDRSGMDLQALYEFCCTNTIFVQLVDESSPLTSLQNLFGVLAIGHYYELLELEAIVTTSIMDVICNHRHLFCEALGQAVKRSIGNHPILAAICKTVCDISLIRDCITKCDADTVEVIVANTKKYFSAGLLLGILKQWHDAAPEEEDDVQGLKRNRSEWCRTIVSNHLSLKNLTSSFLGLVGKEYPFVDRETIFDALIYQQKFNSNVLHVRDPSSTASLTEPVWDESSENHAVLVIQTVKTPAKMNPVYSGMFLSSKVKPKLLATLWRESVGQTDDVFVWRLTIGSEKNVWISTYVSEICLLQDVRLIRQGSHHSSELSELILSYSSS